MPQASNNDQPKNIFEQIPADLSEEFFQDLLTDKNVRIERIVSKGHSSPEQGWYDQDENEWVIVIEGAAKILFELDNRVVELKAGSFLNIPAHQKHQVLWTDPNQQTVWLAVFY